MHTRPGRPGHGCRPTASFPTAGGPSRIPGSRQPMPGPDALPESPLPQGEPKLPHLLTSIPAAVCTSVSCLDAESPKGPCPQPWRRWTARRCLVNAGLANTQMARDHKNKARERETREGYPETQKMEPLS